MSDMCSCQMIAKMYMELGTLYLTVPMPFSFDTGVAITTAFCPLESAAIKEWEIEVCDIGMFCIYISRFFPCALSSFCHLFAPAQVKACFPCCLFETCSMVAVPLLDIV